MKSWLKIASFSLVIGSVAAACTISEGDPDDDGIGGADPGSGGRETGGTSGTTGGRETGGRETGGTETGGAATGGADTGGAATGGAGGAEPLGACAECMMEFCPDQLTACDATGDSVDQDGYLEPDGTPDCFNEFLAYQNCLEAAWINDGLDYNQAVACDSEAALVESDVLGATQDVVLCVKDTEGTGNDCIAPCLDFTTGAGGAGG